MDAAELIAEFRDRHAPHLIYEGPYRLPAAPSARSALGGLAHLFDDWRQRVYSFDDEVGASVVLYRPLGRDRMRWDVVVAEFFASPEEDPFAFRHARTVPDLRWAEVQRTLDRIKAGR